MNNSNSKKKLKKRKNGISYPKLAAVSFLAIILIGSMLLMLPESSKDGQVSFVDALMTATSATCVTGLVVADTFTKWTLLGQLIILCMIQIGGLGFITIITLLIRIVKKRFSVKEKILFRESIGSIFTGDMKSLGRRVIIGTIMFEVAGAVALSTQFIPSMGWKNGLYTAVFLSVSAFCNAGFDVMGRIEAGSSLMTVNDKPIILLTICALIIIGGIGFIVWDDLVEKKFRFKQLSLHTKITLVTTLVLLMLGTCLYLAFEYSNTMKDMSFGEKLLNAFFTSTTTRTAGFNSINTGDMADSSKLLTYFLMLIGGSSASTAGGIKTTTVAVLFLCALATLNGTKEVTAFGKSISEENVRRAISVTLINLSFVIAASFIIAMVQPTLKYFDILFECFSAVGTVGMSTGITSSLAAVPKLIITLLMFIGRLSSLTFVFSIRFENNLTTVKKPVGNILVG